MIDSSTGSLTLLISHPGRRCSWNLDFSSLRPFVSRVLLVEAGSGAYLVPMLAKALAGVNIDHLGLNRSGTAAQWSRLLRRRLDGSGSWALVLQAGANASAHRRFKLPDRLEPQSVIHRSPSGDEAYWAPALVPDPECLSIDASGRIVVNAELSVEACHEGISITDRQSFLPTRQALALSLEAALEDYRGEAKPARAFDIAEYHFRLKKYAEAEFWHRRYVSGHDDEEKRWTALYRLACCLKMQGQPWPRAEAAMTEAFDTDPDRAEPLYHLARHYLEACRHRKSFDLAAIGMDIRIPRTSLPFEISIYKHRLPLAYMAAAVELRRDRECIETANRMLREPGIPEPARVEAAGYRTSSVARFQPYYPLSIRRKNPIVVITPFRNAGEFLHRCVESLSAQDYAHCRFVLIDDASDDGGVNAIELNDPRFTIIRNDIRRGTIRKQLDAINDHCEPGDIPVYVDGEDWLIDNHALSYVNDFFNSTRCWVMYGQYRDSKDRYGRCEPVTKRNGPVQEAVNDMHFPMHIRAHRAGLAHRLQEVDPELKRLRDDDGEFLDPIADMALMRALMQLAGLEHIRYNDRILYEYNARNPESHYRAFERRVLQDRQGRLLLTREPLESVPTYLLKNGHPAPVSVRGTGLLFIALDGMTPRLIHQWASEGLLPNLGKLIDAGHVRDIEVPKGFGNDTFWNSLATGRLPDEHGYYYRNFWRPDEYKLSFYDLDNELGGEPFGASCRIRTWKWPSSICPK